MADYENEKSSQDEVTLVEVAVVIKNLVHEMLGYWWVFLLLFISIGGLLVGRALMAEPTYRASVTYLVDQEGGGSGINSILGQFGIGIKPGNFNLAKITELARSRRIMGETLFQEAEVDGEIDMMANHIIKIYELDQAWKEQIPELDGFRFVNDSIEGFDRFEKTAFKRVVSFVSGSDEREGLVTANYNDVSAILKLTAETINEEVSIQLADFIFDNLRAYYVEQATEKQMRTYSVVRSKSDSIGLLIASKTAELAKFSDANQNIWSQSGQLERVRLQNDLQKLQLMHGESLKNLEIADFALRTAMPSIQPIDRPLSPLSPQKPSIIVSILIAAFLSLLIGTLLLFIRTLVRKMREIE